MGCVKLFSFCKSDVSAVQSHPRSWFWWKSKAPMHLLVIPSY